MDLHEYFYGPGRRFGRQKGVDIIHRLCVPLKDLYNGCVRKIVIEKNVICKTCEGSGCQKRAFLQCITCRGVGLKATINLLQPGMIQQMQSVCNNCGGHGECINPDDRCANCNGKKVVVEKKILEVNVEKGMVDGQTITCIGEGDEVPQLEPGDLIVVLIEKKHHTYKRSGNDLILQLKIELVEALCGFKKVIKTLDGRSLVITATPGKVLKHCDVKCVLNEGMPQYHKPLEKGRMIIQFLVNDELPADKIALLESCLPARPVEIIPDSAEEVSLIEIDPEHKLRRRENNSD